MLSISTCHANRFTMWFALLFGVIFGLPAFAADGGGDRYTGKAFSGRSPVLARHGMAATSHPIASSIAVDVLKKGGSAIDAAIAANAMLALVEPHACGIGGDLFAIVWDPESNQLHGYNGSGRTPAAFSYADMQEAIGDADRIPQFGPLSVSVPGAVDGWFALHERFGRLPMEDLLQPAVDYANEGVAITEVDATLWKEAIEDLESLNLPDGLLDELRRTYTIDGRPPKTGEIFINRNLAESYSRIADGGRESFYQGEIARRIVEAIAKNGGALSAGDLRSHKGEWVTPMSVNYRGYDVYELPPNSQGLAALQILNLVETYPLGDWGRNSANYWHVMVEASKIAYEDRAKYYADPAFSDEPIEWLISKDYANERRKLIDMSSATQELVAGSPPSRGDTTYIATADESGMMVSLIQSNYWEFGSGLVAEGTGFALQNRGYVFSMDPQHANVYEPGKRPFHTIIPAFVTKDGAPVMAFGVMGGFLQPQGHAQILVNMIDFGMNVQEAGDAARFVHSGDTRPIGGRMTDGGEVLLESGIDEAVVDELIKRGHRVVYGKRTYVGSVGGYQAVWRDPETGVYHGATEMRFDGAAAGY